MLRGEALRDRRGAVRRAVVHDDDLEAADAWRRHGEHLGEQLFDEIALVEDRNDDRERRAGGKALTPRVLPRSRMRVLG